MLDQLLGSAKDGITKDLSSRLGLNSSAAGGFLSTGLALLESAIKSGKLDVQSLLSGNVSGVLSKLDLGSLAGLVGGDAGKARTGMTSILGPLMTSIKGNAGGAEQILGQLTGDKGGMMSKVAGVAGKLFGKS